MKALIDDDRGPTILALLYSGSAVAAAIVALRLWVRVKIIRNVGLDDWLVAASLVCGVLGLARHEINGPIDICSWQILTIVSVGFLAHSVHFGLGRHIRFLRPERSKNAIKFLWIAFCFTPSAEGLAKASISIMLIVGHCSGSITPSSP